MRMRRGLLYGDAGPAKSARLRRAVQTEGASMSVCQSGYWGTLIRCFWMVRFHQPTPFNGAVYVSIGRFNRAFTHAAESGPL